MKSVFILFFILISNFLMISSVLESKTLPTPQLLSPANNSTNVSIFPEFIWSKVDGAANYKIQYSIYWDLGGNWTLWTGDTSVKVETRLLVNTVYYWRVKVENSNGYNITDTSAWSDIYSFKTLNAPLNVPIFFKPIITHEHPIDQIFSWYKVDGADEYQLQIALDQLFDNLVKDTITKSLDYRIKLQYKTQYYYRCRAINTIGFSPWSDIRPLKTERQFSLPPQLQSPKNEQIAVQIKGVLVWSSYRGGDNFQVVLSMDKEFSNVISDKIVNVLTTNYDNLKYGTIYYWKVKAFSSLDTSGWSPVWSFRTEYDKLPGVPAEVVLLKPEDNAEYSYYILSGDLAIDGDDFIWQPGDSTVIDRYWFEISDNLDFNESSIDSFSNASARSPWEAIRIVNISPVGYWRVKAGNEAGWGKFSDVRKFTIKTYPVEEKDKKLADRPAVYPNPAGEYIEISGLNKGLQPLVPEAVRLYDVLGECVKEIPPTPLLQGGKMKVDVSGLAAGVYFVRIGEWAGRFVKI